MEETNSVKLGNRVLF